MRSENAELRHKVATLEGSTKSLSVNRYLEEDELGASELDERRTMVPIARFSGHRRDVRSSMLTTHK
jgi:hypothetical protein